MSLTFSGIGLWRAATAAGGRLANWPNVMSLTRAIRIFNHTCTLQSRLEAIKHVIKFLFVL